MISVTRRNFLLSGTLVSLNNDFLVESSLLPSADVNVSSYESEDGRLARSIWISNALEKRGLRGRLYLSRFVDEIYFLTKPIHWINSDAEKTKYSTVTVPAGFVTDLATIPPIFFTILRPDGKYAHAAIIHDYLYWVQERSRGEADMIFKLAMQDLELDPATVITLYEAVHSFGERAWSTNRKLRERGEKRILRRYPTDPAER